MKKTCVLIWYLWAIQAGAQIRTPEQGVLPDRLTIDQAVAEAVENNIGLLAERYNVSVAQARVITARLRPNPILSMGGDHLPLAGTTFNTENMAGPPEYAVRTDFVIERGGKRGQRINAADAAVSAAQLRLRNAIRTLVLDVQSAFVDVLLGKENLALAQQNYESLNNVVQVNATRVKTGDLAEVDLLRSRVAALQYQNSVFQADLRLRTAYQRLRLLLGRGVAARPVEAIGDLRRDVQPITPETVLTDAQQMRPDLLALRQEQARSQYDLRLQLATRKADYDVGAEFRRQQGLAGKGNSLGLFFSTPLPVFNRNQGEIERARREQDQIGLQIRALEQSIRSEVETTYQQYLTAKTLLDSLKTPCSAKRERCSGSANTRTLGERRQLSSSSMRNAHTTTPCRAITTCAPNMLASFINSTPYPGRP
jgi:cobalt-zinc-cadmium efflux system outer membrane protein